MIGNVHACVDVLTLFLTDTDMAAEFSTLMTTMATNLETLMDSPHADGLALMQGMWDGMHAAGPPKPPWELLPGLVPAPASPSAS